MKKKFFTKVIALILCIANMFTIIPSGVFADTNDVVTLDFNFRNNGSARYGQAQLGDFWVSNLTDAKESNATRRAFCATNTKGTPTSRNQFGLLTSSNDERLARVLYYGYVKPSSEVYGTTNPSDNLKIIVTSTAFSQIYSGESYGNSGDALTMKNALINIANNTNYTVPNNRISVTKSNLAVSVSGNKQVSESTTFNGYQGNTISINVPQGITLVNESKAGQKTTNGTATITAGETFHFEADLSFAGEINTGNIYGSLKDFKAFIARGSNGLQDISTYGYVENSSPVQIKATFTPQLGNLEIIKDSDKYEITDLNRLYDLNRAEFKITNLETGKTYTQKVTRKVEDGSATVKFRTVFENIPVGTYKVEEITASIRGYRINKQSREVTVEANKENKITFTNVPIVQVVSLVATKKDENNKPLKDAEFTLKFYKGEYTKEQIISGESGNPDRTWVIKSDSEGKVVLDTAHLVDGSNSSPFYISSGGSICLPYGTLAIEETKSPAGYKDNNELYVYTIKGENGVAYTSKFTPLTITNEPKMGTAEIIKTSTDGEVEGIEFQITDSNEVTKSYFTDSNGKITQNLKEGHYVVREIVPEGYVCNSQNPQGIDVVEGQTERVTFENKPNAGKLVIRKRAVDTNGNPVEGNLSGFKFEVFKLNSVNDQEGTSLGTFTTGDDGKISISNIIVPGYYRVHENLPVGSEYAQPADQVKEVKIGTTTTFNFLNAAQTFKFKLRKVLNTSSIPRNYRPTFKFNIESEDGLYKATEEILANSETTIDIEVPKSGTYKITEVLTEDQQKYWKNPEEGTKTVVVVPTNTPDENVPTVTFTNNVKEGRILIKKTSDDGFVNHVEFVIKGRAYAGNLIDAHGIYTNEQGEYSDAIPLGEYTIYEVGSSSPYYYESSGDVKLTVAEEDKTYPADFTNTYDRTIRIVKDSATGSREGFTFRITSDVLQSPIEVTTGEDGFVDVDNLKAGTYTIEEINLPEEWKQPDPQTVVINYIEKAGKTDAQIAEELKPIEVTFENKYKPAILDIKKVSSDNATLGGWTFTIVGTDYKGKKVDKTVTTGNDGNIIAEDTEKLTLEAGSYTITEIDIPDGMVVPEPIQVTLEPGQTKTVEFANKFKKGSCAVYKLSEDKIYAGFTFRLYGSADNGEEIDKTVTTEEISYTFFGGLGNGDFETKYGYALFKDIPVGTYKIEEIVPERYKRMELEPQPFRIEEGDELTFEFNNVLDEVDYTIIKKSAYNGPVEGFKFIILPVDVPGLDVNNFQEEYTTDRDGKINVRLKPGKYEISEIAYPGEEGIPAYAVAPETQTVVIEPKGESTEPQSVTFTNRLKQGDLGTTAVDGKTNKRSAYVSEETTIIDTVAYEDFIPNQRYKMVGKIMDKATGEELKINGEEVVVEKVFTANETGNGSEDLEFTFNSMDLKGKQIVVFEKSYVLNDGDTNGVEVAKHEDINDENQTITFVDPKISTQAKDTLTELNSSYVQTNSTIVDTVNCKGIIPNVGGYTLKCDLIDKDTGEVIVVNDKPVSATKEFTANSEEVNVNVYLYVDTTSLIGKNVVCYETLYYGDDVIAEHKDINDEGQTIEYKNPDIKTTIKDKDTKTQDAYTKKKTTLIDTVSYTGLIPGKTYTVSGILMNKETNEPLLIDGKEVIATKEFVAKEADGTVDIEFKFNSIGLKDKEIVAFEYLDYEDVEIAVHADINDKAQTIKFIEGDIPKTGGKFSTEFVLVIMSAVIVTAAVLFRKKYKKARNN